MSTSGAGSGFGIGGADKLPRQEGNLNINPSSFHPSTQKNALSCPVSSNPKSNPASFSSSSSNTSRDFKSQMVPEVAVPCFSMEVRDFARDTIGSFNLGEFLDEETRKIEESLRAPEADVLTNFGEIEQISSSFPQPCLVPEKDREDYLAFLRGEKRDLLQNKVTGEEFSAVPMGDTYQVPPMFSSILEHARAFLVPEYSRMVEELKMYYRGSLLADKLAGPQTVAQLEQTFRCKRPTLFNNGLLCEAFDRQVNGFIDRSYLQMLGEIRAGFVKGLRSQADYLRHRNSNVTTEYTLKNRALLFKQNMRKTGFFMGRPESDLVEFDHLLLFLVAEMVANFNGEYAKLVSAGAAKPIKASAMPTYGQDGRGLSSMLELKNAPKLTSVHNFYGATKGLSGKVPVSKSSVSFNIVNSNYLSRRQKRKLGLQSKQLRSSIDKAGLLVTPVPRKGVTIGQSSITKSLLQAPQTEGFRNQSPALRLSLFPSLPPPNPSLPNREDLNDAEMARLIRVEDDEVRNEYVDTLNFNLSLGPGEKPDHISKKLSHTGKANALDVSGGLAISANKQGLEFLSKIVESEHFPGQAPLSVNNLSQRVITEEENDVLALGLKYIFTPKPNIKHFLKEIKEFCNDVRTKFFVHRYMNKKPSNTDIMPVGLIKKNPNWVAPQLERPLEKQLRKFVKKIHVMYANHNSSNSDDIQRNIVRDNNAKSILLNLLADRSIRICNSDKNLGLTIVARSWYDNEVKGQLSDLTTYEPVHESEIDLHSMRLYVMNAIDQSVGKKGNEKLLKYLLSKATKDTCKMPKFYILPKIHKDPVKGRPISPNHSWITSPASRWIAKMLLPVQEWCDTVLRDSTHLIMVIKNKTFLSKSVLVTMDVASLYTNIDPDLCIPEIMGCHSMWRRANNIIMDDSKIVLLEAMLKFVLHCTFLKGPDGTKFRQKVGLAMGTSMAPIVANIYMFMLEKRTLEHVNEYGLGPNFYHRFIDDIIAIWDTETVEDGYIQFCNSIAEQAPRIKFTRTVSEHECAFLDLKLTKVIDSNFDEICSIKVSLHEKSMNRYLYIPFDSYHPRNVLKSFIKTELLRYLRCSDDESEYDTCVFNFFKRLRRRKYPAEFLIESLSSIPYSMRNDILNKAQDSKDKNQENTNLFCKYTPNPQICATKLGRSLNCLLNSLKNAEADGPVAKNTRIIKCKTRGETIANLISKTYAKEE